MPQRIHVAPSILSADYLCLGQDLDSVRDADLIHFDVMDGCFVPQISYGHPVLKHVLKGTDLPVDVHLMISNPDEAVSTYFDLKPAYISFHLESANHPHRILSAIRDAGIKPAVAINPGTPVCMVEPLLHMVDMVLIMSVNPGYGGQSFIETTHERLRELRRLCAQKGVSPLVEVDGGVGANNARDIVAAGADVLVAGSSVFREKNRSAAIRAIREAGMMGLSSRDK